ncbi:MAG: hypothetical protein HY735_18645 [Verrucomicrobia bacterium]|nr:hypothetical protein [Verrucomicrobiota bacterium]
MKTTRKQPVLDMRSPTLALGWEIWRRYRTGITAVWAVLVFAAAMNWFILATSRFIKLAEAAGYALLALALVVTFGVFHFTEGQRTGGFGSFPRRLFNLPVATHWLVAIPMAYGAVAVIVVYLAGCWLIFAPLGKALPLAWPCLYLVSGLAQFQMIIWSFPERRYLKLLGLVLFGTFIWLAHAGDFDGLDSLYEELRLNFSRTDRGLFVLLSLYGVMLLTWRLMVFGLAVGLSGRKGWYYLLNLLTAAGFVALFAFLLWRSDQTEQPLHLYDWWNCVTWLPLIAAMTVVAKIALAAWAWLRVHELRMLSPRLIYFYFVLWIFNSGLWIGLVLIAFPHTPWLRNLLVLIAMLLVPLAGPAMAMIAFARNRSR